MAVILSCHELGFSFGDRQVLSNISFEVKRGSFCAILGRNGSGKTTLIQCLNRILEPTSGRIQVKCKDLAGYSRKQVAQLISLVPQEHIDIFPYSVLDVVVMGRTPFLNMMTAPSNEDYNIAANALDELNAGCLAHKNFNRISGGERQIALLARALAQTTEVMLLDEPTNHLDFNNQYHLLAAIRQLCRTKGISVIASMHDPNLASVFADQVVMIKNGEILAKGKTRSIMTPASISTLYDTDTGAVKINRNQHLFFPDHILSGQVQGNTDTKNAAAEKGPAAPQTG